MRLRSAILGSKGGVVWHLDPMDAGHSPVWRVGSRQNFSSTDASFSVEDGFDPFTTHHNSEDADRADRMVRDLVKRRLTGGAAIEVWKGFLGGALNSYRVLSEKAAEQARRGKRRTDASFTRKADDLLAFAEQAYERDPALSPDIKSYSIVLDAYAKIGDPEGAEAVSRRLEKLWEAGNAKVKPNTILYNTVINAWAKSQGKGAAQRAEAILEHMEQLHQQGHEDVRPDVISYGAVINAWARSREKGAAQRAEAILNHMLKLDEGGREGCCPNTTCFTAVIDAWARSRDIDAPRNAEALLEKMEQLHGQGYEDVRPDVISFNAVINAWAKSRDMNAYEHAKRVFGQMQGMGQAAEPDVLTYTSLINALSVSSVPDKAEKAFNMLLEMETMTSKGNRDVAPTSITFGAVMKACARTSGNQQVKRKALRVALGVCDKLRRSPYLSIDPLIYDPLFTTIANASKGQEYIKLVSEVFKLCCEDGVLNDVILQTLRRRAPKDVFAKLVGVHAAGGRDISVADLPADCSKNAKGRY